MAASGPAVLIGNSPEIRRIAALVPKLARMKVAVLLLGESGTGKDVLARAIHEANPTGAFVPIDCTALAGNLLESELFGHVRGAFTGAVASKTGLIDLAHKGTAFFDEIGDVPIDLQVKLLRLLERKEYRPVGSVVTRRAEFRVIAATNRDLADMVERCEFRRDLYYRLKGVTVRLPPLRERREDIEPLARHFLAGVSQQFRLEEDVLEKLRAYDWPGNVRELEHCIQAMAAVVSSSHILDSTLLPSSPAETPSPGAERESAALPSWRAGAPEKIPPLAEVERQHIVRVLEFTNWDCAAAARALGIGRTTLYRRLRDFGLLKANAHGAGGR